MTMHLAHPSLSLNGKKKGKKKFRNAEAAQRARQQQAEWNDLKSRWGEVAPNKTSPAKQQKADFKEYKPKHNPLLRTGESSKHTRPATSWDPCTKAPDRVYTGDKIIGIGVMHKSNAVPIFSEQEAIDISSMRR